MSYVDKNLLPGEIVKYRASRHWIVLIVPIVFGVFLIVLAIATLFVDPSAKGNAEIITGAGLSLFLIGGLFLLTALFRRRAIEMAVTSRRIVIKQGILRTRSLDMARARVESVQIDQGLLGKMCGYGNVTIRGVGGTPEPFSKISRPFEFRRQVQILIDPQGLDASNADDIT
jgi:membrane protein YdbS with pleckstrin-like domain